MSKALIRLQKQMEVDFLKQHSYEEINDMFRELKSKLNDAEHRIQQEREKWEKELEYKTKALKNLVTEVYKTKQHHSNIDLKESLERAESLTTK